ncbi:MAG: hypothetical protein HC897_18675 [Thermoanaerobaculia bacterium]|nr:hypothetical protein [Thermoanaerobaculia bacterium]
MTRIVVLVLALVLAAGIMLSPDGQQRAQGILIDPGGQQLAQGLLIDPDGRA